MLIELSAENIAIMDRVDVRFGPGFTAITGETGAGKTLLIDAISLCLGERADTNLIRKGASNATVQAVFDPPVATRTLLDELGYGIADDQLYLQRELAYEGKSVCRINGKLAPVSVLKAVGDSLADLHGQHEHQSLIHPASHLGMLDAWIGEEAHLKRNALGEKWDLISALKAERELLQQGAAERERMLDVLRFQVNEIEDAGVRSGEIEELQQLLKRLQGAEGLQNALEKTEDSLYAADVSSRSLIQSAKSGLMDAAAIDEGLSRALDAIISAELSLEEAIDEVKAARQRVEYDPEKIEAAAERLNTYSVLRRKYGDSEDSILEFLANARNDLDRLENAEQLSNEVDLKIDSATAEYDQIANELTLVRKKSSEKFSKLVQSELQELGMPQAKFECSISLKPPSRDGVDQFEFLISANAGEVVKPLAKIASGGEMSRVMLAVKTVMAGKGGIPTLVFDEIDTGLGGQTAAVVARKLSKLGESYQVLAITHVAQIAAKASSQVSIEKRVVDDRTTTIVRELGPDERIEEIARMVGGETVGEAAVANAKQLMRD